MRFWDTHKLLEEAVPSPNYAEKPFNSILFLTAV